MKKYYYVLLAFILPVQMRKQNTCHY